MRKENDPSQPGSRNPSPPGESREDGGGFNRRDLLRASTLLGSAGLVGQVTAPSTASAQQAAAPAPGAVAQAGLDLKQVLAKARERLYPTCRVCQVCDGVACSGDGGGIAGSGTGMSFQNNFAALQRVKVLMSNVHDITRADPSTSIFEHKISFPAVAAPMGPAATRFGTGMTQEAWFDALVGGCVTAGTIGSVGDDPRYAEADVKRNLSVIKQYKGQALYNTKPAPNSILLKWLPLIEEVGPAWVSIDVDSGAKSVAELCELVKAFKTPIVIKGIMRVDDALRCFDAGVAGIAVSNHGGRRQDHTAGAAEVLPAIAARLKGKIPILADGCVQTGTDVLKYLALGADLVMVGRHILRAAYGAGPAGVALFMNRMRTEFQSAMLATGVPTVSKIGAGILYS